jgi:hypothetical protein
MVMKVSTIEGTRMVMGADVLKSEAPIVKAAEHMGQDTKMSGQADR